MLIQMDSGKKKIPESIKQMKLQLHESPALPAYATPLRTRNAGPSTTLPLPLQPSSFEGDLLRALLVSSYIIITT